MSDNPQNNEALDLMLERVALGDVRAVARALSLVEDGGSEASELLSRCVALGRRSRRIGLTGPPGAGKSTLADAMVRALRGKGERVGVVAVDPSSPYTGGALLGDRIRMQGFSGDDGVFIRSMASRGAVGGVARGVDGVCAVMEAAGLTTVLIETLGVGQDEVEVAKLAAVTVLLLVPGMGDDVQSMKAGVMEAADIYVVNKSDQLGADRVEQEILAMQGLTGGGPGWVAPVIQTVATTGQGAGALLEALDRWFAEGTPRKQVARASVRLDHLGVAVKSIASARGLYELIGLHVTQEETVEHEQVRTAMLALGDSRIELLEPTAEHSTIGRFLAKHGEGLHHVAVRVEGVDAHFQRLRQAGIRLASDRVRVGAGGHRYFFVHPASASGVLLELVGD